MSDWDEFFEHPFAMIFWILASPFVLAFLLLWLIYDAIRRG